MGKDKAKDKGKGKEKDKSKGKEKDKHNKTGGKNKKKKKKPMSTGKKIAIGAGIAALAVGVGVGGAIYLAKRRKRTKPGAGGVASRDIGSPDGGVPPAVQNTFGAYLQHTGANHIKNSNETIPVPDIVILGLGWDGEDHPVNYDLIASVFYNNATNAGYLQGSFNKTLFNDAFTHTGDDQSGQATSTLGDNENIILDLKRVPDQVQSVTFGAILQSGSAVGTDAYIHMLPLLREEQFASQHGVKEIQDEEEAGEWVESGASDSVEDEFIKLYEDNISADPRFESQRGFVGGKIFRNPSSPTGWSFSPVRQAVPLDPQNGLWPALEHYANLPPVQPY